MKVGDWVNVPTGYRAERCEGLVVEIRDNPSDVEYNFHNGRKIRKIVDVLSEGKVITVWKAHVTVVSHADR